MNIYVYGPPGVGKSTVASILAQRLGLACVDTDLLVEADTGAPVADIIDTIGEAGFRRVEAEICRTVAERDRQVVALGGGALLDSATRRVVEARGVVFCLDASATVLRSRLAGDTTRRPLVEARAPRATAAGDADRAAGLRTRAGAGAAASAGDRLERLLAARAPHYGSFVERVATDAVTSSEVAERILNLLAPRVVSIQSPHLSHDTLIGYGLLDQLADVCRNRSLGGSAVLVSDEGVAEALGSRFPTSVPRIIVRRGEASKTLAAVGWLSDQFIAHGLDRHSVVIAVGGGVVTDLAGFAAAVFMRGIRWVAVPTSLLGMVDASIGGKTGVNLPAGKNLVGTFHPPSLVVTDPTALATLPDEERAAGMAEVVKHAVIGDAGLFEACRTSPVFGSAADLARAVAVKARVVEADPYERGQRAVLNLGHTVGHALEAVSEFRMRHGEAVAIGLVAEALMAERIGLAHPGLAEQLATTLARWGLPVACPNASAAALFRAIAVDKKRAGGRIRFALPVDIGRVETDCDVPDRIVGEVLESLTDPGRAVAGAAGA